jgi:hypothetical protein
MSDRPDGFLKLPFLLKVRNATPRLYNRLLGHNITTVPSFQKKTQEQRKRSMILCYRRKSRSLHCNCIKQLRLEYREAD